MPSTEPRGPKQIYRALKWSLAGLKAAWTFEASFRLEVYLSVIFFPLGLWLGRGGVEKALLVGSLLLVLSAEILNSHISVCRQFKPQTGGTLRNVRRCRIERRRKRQRHHQTD